MFDLPSSWSTSSFDLITPPKFIYGYQPNSKKGTYSIYLINFKNVWMENLSKQQLINKAYKLGCEDLDDSKLNDLLAMLHNGLDNDKTISGVKFPKDNTNDSIIQIDLKIEDLNWPFMLNKQSLQTSIEILAEFNYQQFSNQSYLLHKVANFENIISKKDYYIKFLTENLKLSHGDELIRKFRKINRSEIQYLEDYNKIEWSKRFEDSYFETLKIYSKLTDEEMLWLNISKSINDKETWALANSYYSNPSNNAAEASEKNNLKSLEDSITDEHIKISPNRKKPKRIGIIRNRKRSSVQLKDEIAAISSSHNEKR